MRPLCQGYKQQAGQLCISLKFKCLGSKNKAQKVERELATILEACLLHKKSEILLLPPFLKSSCAHWQARLASWLLQNYFTAQFNSRVKTYALLPREKLKETTFQGFPTYPQEPPTQATAFPWQYSGRVILIARPCCPPKGSS